MGNVKASGRHDGQRPTSSSQTGGRDTRQAPCSRLYGLEVPAGWVRANGKTISQRCRGRNRTRRCFIYPGAVSSALWNADPNLAVSGRPRQYGGWRLFWPARPIAPPGSSPSRLGRLGWARFNGYLNYGAASDPYRVLGSQFGEEVHLLALAEMPVHNHAVFVRRRGRAHPRGGPATSKAFTLTARTADIQGSHSRTLQRPVTSKARTRTPQLATRPAAHTHGATVDSQGGHVHPATMDSQGAHAHQYTKHSVQSRWSGKF